METLGGRAIALIKKRGALRDNQLAAALGSDEASVAAALAPYCDSGELVSCTVNLVGKGEVNEYRISAAGPRKTDDSHLKKPPTPPEQVLAAARAAPVPPPHRSVSPRHSSAPTQPSTGETTMTDVERILAAFKKHGPMTVKQARKYADVSWIGVCCPQLARKGKLVRLGGGPKSSIYGLPGQKPPKGDAGAVATVDTAAKPKRAYKRRAPVRKVQKTVLSAKRPRVARKAPKLRKVRADLRAPRAGRLLVKRETDFAATPGAGAFRAAIASDGAMIFLGAAAGQFELTRAESRAVIEFVRTLDAGAAAA